MGRDEGWALRIRGLTRSFGNIRALRGVDLELKKGRFLTIFGPNGAGKTTLLKILATIIRPSSGNLEIMGMDPRREGHVLRRYLGVVSHQSYLYPHLTSYENLRFYGTMYQVKDLDARIREVLQEVGLWEQRGQPVSTLSRGLLQRAAIARAIIHDPEIIFLDEPFTGLDQQAARRFRSVLDRLLPGHKTIIMTTHNIGLGLEMAQEIAVLVRGRIVYRSTAAELNREEFEPFYASLIQ